MEIIRYSTEGFKPQYQNNHMKGINYHLFSFDINTFPLHLQYTIQQQHEERVKFYKENYEDFRYGIWAFIEGHKNSQALNHLKHKVPCWKATISDETLVYDVNWTTKMLITDSECKIFGFYIPINQLHSLQNIIRIGG